MPVLPYESIEAGAPSTPHVNRDMKTFNAAASLSEMTLSHQRDTLGELLIVSRQSW
jgi:hypothetical protein